MKNSADKLFNHIGNIDESLLNDMEDMKKMANTRKMKKLGTIGVAAAAMVLVAVPNINQTVAHAAYEIPILGSFFEVVTFRSYDEAFGDTQINVEVPAVDSGDVTLDDAINKTTEEYTEMLVNDFKAQTNGATGSIDVSYEVITDNDTWFTLAIQSTETMASGNNKVAYYHIDKTTNEIVTLSDLFEGTDYIKLISDDIRAQMEAQMQADDTIAYVLDETGFTQIDENQNFYFNENGTLVISFDEYTVAAGFMGIVEFEINNSVIEY